MNVVGNGTVSSGKSGVGAILSTWGGETVNLYGGTYKTVGSGNAIYVVGTVNIYDPVIIDASRVQGGKLAGCIYTEREEAVINFHGGQLIGTEIAGNGGAVCVNKGTFTMSGGTIQGGSATSSGGNIHISNATFSMTGGTVEGGDLYIAGPDARISISDGKVLSRIEGKTENISLSGGTISQPLEDTLPENMEMFENEDGNFILYDKDSVAMVGKDMFKSLADAMKKATLDNKLILPADVSNELVISGKKAIDLNGHTVKAIRVEDSAQLKLYNQKQGKIESLTGPMAQVSLENGQYSATVGTITNTGVWSIESGIYADIVNNGKLVISGGEFTGKLVISGGEFTGGLGACESITLTGGTFPSDVSQYVSEGYRCKKSGGKFLVELKTDPSPVPYILIGGGGLLMIILVVAIVLTRPSRKTKTTETKEEI